jgi:defect in organelle trafficking protein DotC
MKQSAALTALALSLALAATPMLASKPATNAAAEAQLGFVKFKSSDRQNLKKIRQAEIKETAISLGARGGLAWRSAHINATLQKEASQMDRIYNFQALLIDNRVLPPVLDQNDASATLANPDTIRLASKSYQIITPARIATTAPNWRNYLMMRFTKPDAPDNSLLPQNGAEVAYWNQCLTQGWKQGLAQANAIFSANLNRLKRDYQGMILYNTLLAEHVVRAPHMAEANMGVTGDATHLRINDRIFRITSHASMQTDSTQWSPVIKNGS